jgi:transcriptional regulator with XRE-family HTH domain
MPKANGVAADVQIGQKLRTVRRANRMSQTELGEAIGVSYQQIQKYELGHSRMSVSTLLKIAQVFGVSPASFYNASESHAASADRGLDGYAVSKEGRALLKAFSNIPNAGVRRRLVILVESLGDRAGIFDD